MPSTFRAPLAMIFLMELPFSVPAQDDPALKELLEKLRSDRIEEREAAVPALIEKGRGIRSALLKTMESADFESRHRIQSVLDVLDTQYRPASAIRPHPLDLPEARATAVRWSPDGSRLAVADPTGPILLLDPPSFKVRQRLEGLVHHPRCVCFSLNGRLLAAGGDKGRLVVWDLQAPDPPLFRHEGGEGTHSAAFSPDGKKIAAGLADGKVKVWDIASKAVERAFTDHALGQARVAFTPDGGRLLSAGGDGSFVLRDARSGDPILRQNPLRAVESLAVSPDGARVALGGAGLVVIETETGKVVSRPGGDERNVNSVSFFGDGRLISAEDDGAWRIWDPRTGTEMEFRHQGGHLYGAAPSPDGRRVTAHDFGGEVHVWDVGRPAGLRRDDLEGLRAVTSDLGRGLFPKNGTLNLRHLHSGKIEAKLKLDPADFLDLSGDGRHVLATTWKDDRPAASLIELESGSSVETWEGKSAIRGALSTGGRIAVVSDKNAKIRVFKRGEGLLREWSLETGVIDEGMDNGVPRALAVSWDDKSVAAVSVDKLWILDVDSGEKRGGVEAGTSTSAAFSPDGRQVLVGLLEGGLRLFDSKSLKLMASFPLERGHVGRVQFSSDGDSFLSTGDEVTLWKR